MADTAIESANKIFKYLQDSDTIMKSSVNRIETIESTLSIPSSTSTSFSNTVKTANKTYTISKVYDLNNETVTLPANIVLVFKVGGGLKNGTIIGTNSVIEASHKIFSNVNVQGTWKCKGQVSWFANGCALTNSNGVWYVPNPINESSEIQLALDSAFRELVFSPVIYYITNTLVLSKEKKLVFEGSDMKVSLDQCTSTVANTSIIYTDQNIDILDISVNETSYHSAVCIQGGNFDVSKCSNYTASCIKVLADNYQKIWGLTINTNVKGKYNSRTGIGIDINPIENQAMAGNKAYITQIRINSNISDFGIGLKATDYKNSNSTVFYNWCTDMVVDGSIINCPLCIDTNVDCDIKAMLQAGYYFSSQSNGQALINYSGVRCSICSNIYDILLQGGGTTNWSNEYAVNVTNASARLVPYGLFNAFLIEGRWLNRPLVKGVLYNNVTEKIINGVA